MTVSGIVAIMFVSLPLWFDNYLNNLALAAVNGLRVSKNEACNRQRSRSITLGDLVDYKQTELCDRSEWYSEPPRLSIQAF